MNQITQVPASGLAASRPGFLANYAQPTTNQAAQANLPASFAVVSIRNRQWSIRYKGETDLVTQNLLDANGRTITMPMAELPVVVVSSSPHISKSYYATDFDAETRGAPDCASIDGIRPDAGVKAQQSAVCQTCPQNAFGSRRTANGNNKGKACDDRRRIALVPSGDIACDEYGGPIMLSLPPMSMRNFAAYCRSLDRFGADVSQVITVMKFASGPNISHPEIEFSEAGWLQDPADYETVRDHADSEYTRQMLVEPFGVAAPVEHETGYTQSQASPLANTRPAHIPQAGVQTQPQPEPEPEPAPTPAPVEHETGYTQSQTSALANTRPAPTPAPTPAPQPAAATPRRRGGGFGGAATPATPATPAPTPAPRAQGNRAAAQAMGVPPVAQAAAAPPPVAQPVPNGAALPTPTQAPDDMSAMIEDLLSLNG